jgi:hypothetical protein
MDCLGHYYPRYFLILLWAIVNVGRILFLMSTNLDSYEILVEFTYGG